MKRPELLAPGGGFLAAYYAFQAGADSVYVGLQEFSARRAAVNFSLEQLRRILGVAHEQDRRVYLALNTVVLEHELQRAAETLFWAELLGVHGVIVQDLGVCELARRHFPRLQLHASTQMAVHNEAGLQVLRELGFRRAILARELTVEQVRRLREAATGVELEVFVHGALCYSVSGMCLASWALTGRSGNRGDCAQICRSLFRVAEQRQARGRQEEGGEQGHFFSCRDLQAGPEVLPLMEAGVDAFKIEGRMKSPEYVYHTVRLYRALIDRGQAIAPGEQKELERNAALGFARKQTRGYLRNPKGEHLLDPAFPGHRGAPLGRVESVGPSGLGLHLEADLSLRDGLGYFPPSGVRDPLAFSVRSIRLDGREVPFARAGARVQIPLPDAAAGQLPAIGQQIFQLSSRFLDLPQPKEGGFPLSKIPFEAHFRLEGRGEGACALEVRVTSLRDAPAQSVRAQEEPLFGWLRELPLQRADRPRPFRPILEELFRESGESLLRLSATGTVLENQTGLGDEELFVPPSALKKAKNAFYAALGEWLEAWRVARLEAVEQDGGGPALPAPGLRATGSAGDLSALVRRQDLSPRGEESHFVSWDQPPRIEELAQVAGRTALPLPPVMREQVEELLGSIRGLAVANPRRRFLVGLSNLFHLVLADELAALPNVEFFADFYLYAANRFAFGFLSRRVPRLLFAYSWIEGSEEDHRHLAEVLDRRLPGPDASSPPARSLPDASPSGPLPSGSLSSLPAAGAALLRIAPGFHPPLFYALSCPVGQEALGDPARKGARGCAGCGRRLSVPLRQGRTRFRLEVRDCLACLYELYPEAPP